MAQQVHSVLRPDELQLDGECGQDHAGVEGQVPAGDDQPHWHCLHFHLREHSVRDVEPDSGDGSAVVHWTGLGVGGGRAPADCPEETDEGEGGTDCLRGSDEEVDGVCVLPGGMRGRGVLAVIIIIFNYE